MSGILAPDHPNIILDLALHVVLLERVLGLETTSGPIANIRTDDISDAGKEIPREKRPIGDIPIKNARNNSKCKKD